MKVNDGQGHKHSASFNFLKERKSYHHSLKVNYEIVIYYILRFKFYFSIQCNRCVQDCCMMNLTVWDEAKQPFWCVSAPVVITKTDRDVVSYDADGLNVSILYQDTEGKVEIRLGQVEHKNEYIVVNLVIYISISKVNKHFGRDY